MSHGQNERTNQSRSSEPLGGAAAHNGLAQPTVALKINAVTRLDGLVGTGLGQAMGSSEKPTLNSKRSYSPQDGTSNLGS